MPHCERLCEQNVSKHKNVMYSPAMDETEQCRMEKSFFTSNKTDKMHNANDLCTPDPPLFGNTFEAV